MTRTGRTLLTAAAVTLALAVAGCSGGSGDGITIGDPEPATAATTTAPPTTPPATGSPSTTPSPEQSAPSTDRCHTSEVRVTFGPEDAGAGQRMGAVILQNISTRTCTVFGYGGLQLLDAQQRPLPIGLTREPPAPTLLRVAPGGKVEKDIRFTVIPSGDGTCPVPASAQVTPPDETDHQVVPWPYGPVCGAAVMGRAYRLNGAG